jgi:hypothetical protein
MANVRGGAPLNANVSRHTMRAALCLVPLLLLAAMGSPVAAEPIAVSTTPAKADYYPWVTFLSQGPIDWFEKNENAKVQGRAYRVAILVSEIYNTVFLEEVALGSEGCCKKLSRSRQFDLKAFAASYGFKGELSAFEFVRWLSPTSFVFRYRDRNFVMSAINKVQVKVEPYGG